MAGRRHGRLLVGLGIALGILMATGGCQSTPVAGKPDGNLPLVRMAAAEPRPERTIQTVTPQMLLQWHVESTRGQALKPIQGQAVVDTEGKVSLGAFGSVKVGGLTPKDASGLIARQMARYVDGPKVRLTVIAGPSAAALAQRVAPAVPAAAPAAAGTQMAHTVQPTSQNAGSSASPIRRTSFDAGQLDLPVPTAGPADSGELPSPVATLPVSPPAVKGPPLQPDNAPGAAEVLAGPPAGVPGHPGGLHPGGPHGPAPNELKKTALPAYMIEPPDILLIAYPQKDVLPEQQITGEHLVRPDGTVSLGIYGSVFVGGLTIEQAREVIFRKLSERLKDVDIKNLNVDVIAYNSKVYYVITDGAGYGEQVTRFPITGSETVLDALSHVNGLPPVASKKDIWVARRVPGDGCSCYRLPVDWISITQCGSTATNYQIMPGDRIYVQSDHWRTFDTLVAKVLSPFERMVGFSLLTGQTANTYKVLFSRTTGSGTTGSGTGIVP